MHFFYPSLFFVAGLLGMLLARFLPKLGDHPFQRQLHRFRIGLCGFTAATLYLFLCLATTPTFRPEEVPAFEDQEQLLAYLQTSQETLIRTSEVLHWFLFLLLFWFLFGVINLSTEGAKLVGQPTEQEGSE